MRNPGIQFNVWVMMIGTALIAVFLAFEMYLFDYVTRQFVFTVNGPKWSEVFTLWIAINLPIVVVPLLVAYAYFHNRKCDEVDQQRDDDAY